MESSPESNLHYENLVKQKGYQFIVGVDEAGRGPLAGPVVAAAVFLKTYDFEARIDDSKKMTHRQREKAFCEIFEKGYVGIGMMNEAVIDAVNILEATYLAMNNAVVDLVARLPHRASGHEHFAGKTCLLIDGNRFKTDLPYQYMPIVGGDRVSLSISCASIVAKVTRDRMLNIYHQEFPRYHFNKHKGYPTKQHRQAICEHGLSMIHRRSFRVNR
ncbi:MAG: ribonuclease HII [Candidatus Omnitrophica bacterium]|nr:ribonuclease HII [Candidatus Omnitrophota bacterium]